MKTKILITGAAGCVGSVLVPHLKDRYDLVLTDIRQPPNCSDLLFIKADLTDLEAMRAVCDGVSTVLHFAADPRITAPWESLLPNNIVGTYNIFQAAHEAGCKRIIFASSVNAVHGYPEEVYVRADMAVRPPNLYGASKVWGEALARFYADTKGLSCICLRLGWLKSPDDKKIRPNKPWLKHVLTYDDLTRLVIASIEASADLRFGIFHGLSNNRHKRFDISDARKILGYEPRDDAFSIADARIGEQRHFRWKHVGRWVKQRYSRWNAKASTPEAIGN